MIKYINWMEEFNEVIKGEKVLVDFWAEWCGPCQMLGPILEEVDAKNLEGVTIAKVNVDENPDIAAAYRIMSIPTMILFSNGNPVKQPLIGVPPTGAEGIVDYIQN